MKEVFLNREANELSFVWCKDKNFCIGETDTTLEDFLAWMKEDWISRGLDTSKLPTINSSCTNS